MATTLFRSHYRVDLTAKQRQVLELVARGRTNFEIAQELGISLDGAKWHLRELFAKLDVGSREEAAEWWREYNSTGARLSRTVRALLPATLGKWLIASGVSAVVVVGVAVALIVTLGNGGHGDEQAVATATSTPKSSPTAGATSTPGPSATPEVIAGLPVQALSWGDTVPLPQGVVAWYWVARPYTDGGSGNLTRAWLDASGELHQRDVLEPLANGRPISVVGNSDMTRLFAAVCPAGLCGLGVSATPDNSTRAITVASPKSQAALSDQLLYGSDDGGITWTHVGNIPGSNMILGVVGDQVLVADYRQATPGPNYQGAYWFYPSGNRVTPPPALANPYPTRVTDTGIQWTNGYTGGAVYDGDGNVVLALSPSDFPNARLIGSLPSGQSFFSWVASENAAPNYMVRLGSDGTAQAIFEASTQWGQPISPTLLIGTVLHPDSATQLDQGVFGVAAFDLDGHTISPVEGLFKTTRLATTAFLMTVVNGAFAEVDTGGDCLNVRQEASTSSKSLGCFADGVLLQRSDVVSVNDDGTTWYSVMTPSGAEGWASAEFLVT